jgi:hypothetical protein
MICPYCATSNAARRQTCQACGAPLASSQELPPDGPANPPPLTARPKTTLDTAALKSAGEQSERLFNTALSAYSTAWRTLGEAIAAGVSGLLLGAAGGALGLGAGGVMCAAVVGLAVGLAQKGFWFTALGAPLGSFIGLALGAVAVALGLGAPAMLLAGTVFGSAAAALGGRLQRRYGWYDRLRPFLGLAGGAAFGLLGALLGTGARFLFIR